MSLSWGCLGRPLAFAPGVFRFYLRAIVYEGNISMIGSSLCSDVGFCDVHFRGLIRTFSFCGVALAIFWSVL